MSIACDLFGHKWNGCTCERCNAHRVSEQDGHDFRQKDGGCVFVCSKCGTEWTSHLWNSPRGCTCTRCGEKRDGVGINHDWDGCKCRMCGKRRNTHDWVGCRCRVCGQSRGPLEDGHHWVYEPGREITAKEHFVRCSVCGWTKTEPHTFRHGDGCSIRCSACGYMTEEHDFVAGICRTCGADESEFFCDLILSGKAGYYDNESQKGDVFISFGDHVTSIPALTRLMIVLAGSDRADHAAPESIVRKIDEQYAGDGKKVDDALAEIALNEAVTPYWRRYACRRIHDLKRRKETAERLEAMEKTP
ncbi:MAG: hypothetical protein IKE81_01335 [Clostridia bacterium]|nr:hypothetical protein [Clostridia bacterium]